MLAMDQEAVAMQQQSFDDLDRSMIDSVGTDGTRYTSLAEVDRDVKGSGSSILGATFNFTNAIIGAGAMGLGGAIAASGGLISILTVLAFAALAKLSNDMIISLTIQVERDTWDDVPLALRRVVSGSGDYDDGRRHAVTYEMLGEIAYGAVGTLAVVAAKSVYAFGCLVAYIVVIKDNFGPAVEGFVYGSSSSDASGGTPAGDHIPTSNDLQQEDWFRQLLQNEHLLTMLLSTLIVLPLCMVRDIAPLARFSFISILSMIAIAFIVVYLFGVSLVGGQGFVPSRTLSDGFVQDWLVIHPGILASLGTFVFTFVAQHTVHLTYESLHPKHRTMRSWKRVSFYSISLSALVSLVIGVFSYMTFWRHTQSDIFQMYPTAAPAVDAAKLLLSVSMLLTFPLPFCTCREMLVVMLAKALKRRNQRRQGRHAAGIAGAGTSSLLGDDGGSSLGGMREMRESLLAEEEIDPRDLLKDAPSLSFSFDPLTEEHGGVVVGAASPTARYILPGGEDRQLVLKYHIFLTVLLWGMATFVALAAPSLGDVLDLVGCVSGTIIAFILPGLFSLKLIGFSVVRVAVVVVGVLVGCVGTFFSLKKLVGDLRS